MNLEKYKSEMTKKAPDRAFVETTLGGLKNDYVKPKSERFKVLKTIGGIGLSAAVLCGAFVGAGTVRTLFEDIEPIVEETKDTTAPEEEIIATDKELLATPLASNPKYTVKVTTPEGKVSLNEDTTVMEMLACGVPVSTENGDLGLQYLCEFFRRVKDENTEFTFITADTTTGKNVYNYYENNIFDEDRYWKYEHFGYLSITKYVNPYVSSLVTISGWNTEPCVSMVLDSWYNSNSMGVVTMYDVFDITGYSKEYRKEMFYDDITKRSELGMPPILSVIYNGECLGAFRMNNFVKNIENGAEYAGVQYTDISDGNEYDERFYSIEYCDGIYSIFTMTNGFGGEFDTQYFEGYEIIDNRVVFDNGEKSYSFALSITPEEDMAKYEGLHIKDSLFYVNFTGNFINAEKIIADKKWVEDIVKNNLLDALIINYTLSTDEYKAVEIETYDRRGDYQEIKLAVDVYRKQLGINNIGEYYQAGEVKIWSPDSSIEILRPDDGIVYALLSDEDLKAIAEDTPSLRSYDGYHEVDVNVKLENESEE